MENIDYRAYIQLQACRHKLTRQQYKTLRGQVMNGEGKAALKGLKKILEAIASWAYISPIRRQWRTAENPAPLWFLSH